MLYKAWLSKNYQYHKFRGKARYGEKKPKQKNPKKKRNKLAALRAVVLNKHDI